jgi:hypothetical protein
VFSPATQRTYYFPCDAWLEAGKQLGGGDPLQGCRKELIAGVIAPTILSGTFLLLTELMYRPSSQLIHEPPVRGRCRCGSWPVSYRIRGCIQHIVCPSGD